MVEANMEAGLSASGRNPLHQHAKKILSFIKMSRRVSRKSIIIEFGADLEIEEIEKCIKELELGYNVKSTQEKGELLYYV
jgi:hypothetical protein